MGKYIFIPPRDNLIFPPTKYGMESPGYLNYLVADSRVWILAGFRQKLNRRSHMRLSLPGSPHWGPAGGTHSRAGGGGGEAVLEQPNHGPWPQESRALQPPPPANKSGSCSMTS